MKNLPLLVALAVLIAVPGFAKDITRQVTVRGNAEVKVVPDQVILTLGVESFDSTMNDAKSDNDRRTKAVLVAATGTDGVPDRNVRTDYLQINPKHHSQYDRSTEIVGYFVRKTITITLDDIDQFEPLLAAALEAGATHVHGIAFRTTDLRKHRDKARAMAIKAAREKAQALSGELDERIGRPITIQDGSASWWSSYGSWWGGNRRGAMMQNSVEFSPSREESVDGPIAPGLLSVTASVSVTFEIE